MLFVNILETSGDTPLKQIVGFAFFIAPFCLPKLNNLPLSLSRVKGKTAGSLICGIEEALNGLGLERGSQLDWAIIEYCIKMQLSSSFYLSKWASNYAVTQVVNQPSRSSSASQ